MTDKDIRPDGFICVWDYPDDPDEPCWDEAAPLAIAYVAGLMGMDPALDFKIECQSVDLKEECPNTYYGYNDILISKEKYLASENKNISIQNLGFIIDGFLTGWLGAHCTPLPVPEKPMAAAVNWQGIADLLGLPVEDVKNAKLFKE